MCKNREKLIEREYHPRFYMRKDSLGQKGQFWVSPGWGWRPLWEANQRQGAEKNGCLSLRCSAGILPLLTKPNQDLKLLLSQMSPLPKPGAEKTEH